MTKLVPYYRVSTAKQGESGLGLDAQRAAVAAYVGRAGGKLVAEFTEVESGKQADRPELEKAKAMAERTGATLVVAKLDRLARNTRFLLGIVESKADVIFCDFPTIPAGAMGKFILTQMAAVAELEAGLISERTKAALAAYKADARVSKRIHLLYPRGVPAAVRAARAGKLGAALPECRDNLSADGRARGSARGAAANAQAAADRAAGVGPLVLELRASGLTLQGVADELNARSYQTRTGKPYTHVAVLRVINRCG